MASGLALLGLAFATAAPPAAAAGVQPLAVVTDTRGDEQLATRLDLAVVRGLGFRLSGAEYRPFQSGAIHHAAKLCEGKTSCIARAIQPAGYGLVLVTLVDPSLDASLAVVRLVDVSAEKQLTESLATATSSVGLPAEIERTTRRLADAQGWSPAGRIDLVVAPQGASVKLLDGEHVVDPRATPTVAPGPYWLLVEHEGWKPIERSLVVSPDELVELNISMEPKPEDNTWMWVGIAAAATLVAGGITAGVVLSQRDKQVAFCNPNTGRCL